MLYSHSLFKIDLFSLSKSYLENSYCKTGDVTRILIPNDTHGDVIAFCVRKCEHDKKMYEPAAHGIHYHNLLICDSPGDYLAFLISIACVTHQFVCKCIEYW